MGMTVGQRADNIKILYTDKYLHFLYRLGLDIMPIERSKVLLDLN